jgi:molybdopterin synthase catalytic subunit/molybdopterin converting factor small subunit
MTEMITVRVRTFAGLREALGFSEAGMTLPVGTDIAGLVAQLAADYPAARLTTRRYTVAVNRAYAPPDRVLADGDEVGLIPPVSGGSGHGVVGAGSLRPYEITDRPISLDDVAARVAAPERGGITLFAGTVRGVTAGKNGASGSFTTDYLEYEAYPEMTEASFADIAAEAHRVGRQEVGDISIAIAVAAAHRADTFDACRYIIDRIKQISPIWKREVGPDGSSWVEGPESAV